MQTVEHLLAAAAALELDDLTVELDGPEPPIGDGSFAPFLDGADRAPASQTTPGEPVVYRVHGAVPARRRRLDLRRGAGAARSGSPPPSSGRIR